MDTILKDSSHDSPTTTNENMLSKKESMQKVSLNENNAPEIQINSVN